MATLAVTRRFDLTDAQVGAAGTPTAHAETTRSAVTLDKTAADRRDALAGAGRRAVA